VPLLGSENLTLKFMGFALGAWVVSGLFTFCNVFPEWNAILQFTYANTALRHLFAWGFFAMAMLGGIYYVAPRLLGSDLDWPCGRTVRWVYRLIAVGVIIITLAGVGMAWGHGQALQQIGVDAMTLQTKAINPMRIAFLGEILFMVSSFIFLGSLLCLLSRNCCGELSPMALWRQIREAKMEGETKGGAQ
jgi:cytochrome c oxidase cbb3-type subunit 1